MLALFLVSEHGCRCWAKYVPLVFRVAELASASPTGQAERVCLRFVALFWCPMIFIVSC